TQRPAHPGTNTTNAEPSAAMTRRPRALKAAHLTGTDAAAGRMKRMLRRRQPTSSDDGSEKKQMNRILVIAVFALLTVPACIFEADHPHPVTPVVSDGTLTVDWTIDGSKDPGECAQGDVASIDIAVQT